MKKIASLLCAFILILAVGCSKQETTTAEPSTVAPETTTTVPETTIPVETTTEPEASTEPSETTTTEEPTEPPYDGPSMDSAVPWPEINETVIPGLHFHREEDGIHSTACTWDLENGILQLGEEQYIYPDNSSHNVFAYDGSFRITTTREPTEVLNESLIISTYSDSHAWSKANLYNPELRDVVWVDASGEEKHFEIPIIPMPKECSLRKVFEKGTRADVYLAKEEDAFLLFFFDWNNEEQTMDAYVLRYYPADADNYTWHKYDIPQEYASIYASSSHDECKYIDGKFYMTSATHIVCLDLETGEVTTLDDAIGQVTAMYPEHSQFDPQGIPVPYEVEAQWGKYLIISMPMRPTDPSNPVNYSAWLAVDSSTHQVAGLFETEKTALPSGEFEYVVTCYDENLEPLGEPYTLPTPGGFFFATEPAK